jgi:cobalt-zinc-cadmium efflux system membrane fusion protein
MKKTLILFIIVSVAGCQQESAEKAIHQIIYSGDTITLAENSAIDDKLEIETISPELYQKKITTSGIVMAIPNNYAQVASPFPGRIFRCFICLGQKVKAGREIFIFFAASSCVRYS